MHEINSSQHHVFVPLCGTFNIIKFIWEMEMQVGEKFFQFNFQKNLKLSHKPHLPITRSGMHLMQNQQITRRETTGNYGGSCFHVKISSLFSCFCLAWSCCFFFNGWSRGKTGKCWFSWKLSWSQKFYPNLDALWNIPVISIKILAQRSR